MESDGVVVRDAAQRVVGTYPGAHWPVLLTLSNGSVLLGYEQDGRAFVRAIEDAATTSARH